MSVLELKFGSLSSGFQFQFRFSSKMKKILSTFVSVIILIIAGCTEKFTPDIDEVQYIPVVEGLITDQPEVYTIRLYWSIPIGESKFIPLGRCDVEVHDDRGIFTGSLKPQLQESISRIQQHFRGWSDVNTNSA